MFLILLWPVILPVLLLVGVSMIATLIMRWRVRGLRRQNQVPHEFAQQQGQEIEVEFHVEDADEGERKK